MFLCSNCGVQIPAEWKNVIIENICPNCKGEIVNPDMRQFIDELAGFLDQMPPGDSQGLAVWLLSNFNIAKIGSPKPIVSFYGEKSTRKNSNVKVQDNNSAAQFHKNAGVSPKTKAELVALINGGKSEDDDEPEDDSDLSPEDRAYIEVAKKAMIINPTKPTGKIANNDISNIYGEENDLANVDLPQSLQQDRMERLAKQQEVGSGKKVGLIKRV